MASVLTGYLQVEIKGTLYGLEILPADSTACGCKVARLTKDDADRRGGDGSPTVYDVTEGTDRTTCDCPDWTRRHAALPYSDGCKHIRAMVSAGIIENIRPAATFEPEPEIDSVSGRGVLPNTTDVPATITPTVVAETPDEDTLILRAQAIVNEAWHAATGRADAPSVANLASAADAVGIAEGRGDESTTASTDTGDAPTPLLPPSVGTLPSREAGARNGTTHARSTHDRNARRSTHDRRSTARAARQTRCLISDGTIVPFDWTAMNDRLTVGRCYRQMTN